MRLTATQKAFLRLVSIHGIATDIVGDAQTRESLITRGLIRRVVMSARSWGSRVDDRLHLTHAGRNAIEELT